MNYSKVCQAFLLNETRCIVLSASHVTDFTGFPLNAACYFFNFHEKNLQTFPEQLDEWRPVTLSY